MQTMTKRQPDPASSGQGRVPPDPEVAPRPKRRAFTAAYKRRILEAADACTEPGEIGALLRREGLYSSHLASWRRERERGADQGLDPKKRGRKGKTPEQKRIAELEQQLKRAEREKQRLEAKLKRADLMLDLQKKVSEILGIPLAQPESDESDS